MSISSSEGSPLPVDLATKYQKLAAEYAKVRAQVTVLKKGILEEQTRTSDMKEQLKMKDQIVRKHDQELDSLIFRNQQLTKRVTFLQEELELQLESKRGRSRQENNVTEESKLFQEELQNRILENSQLLLQLEEKENEHENERRIWMEEIDQLQKSIIAAKQRSCQSCSCEELQKKSSKLELCKKETNQFNGGQGSERTSQQEMWSLLKKLPFLDVVALTDKLASSCGYKFNLAISSHFFSAFDDFNHEAVSSALQHHISQITAIILQIKENDTELKQIYLLLKDLESAIIRSISSTLIPFQLEAAFNSLVQITRSIHSASTYHLSLAQFDSENSQGVIETLVSTQDKCKVIEKSLIESKANLKRGDNARFTQQPCLSCLTYEKKIDELNSRIKELSESLHCRVRNPEKNTLKLENKLKDAGNIKNEMGESISPWESEWSSDAVKEFVISKCSSSLADVQLAESKVSRITCERDAAQSRLEHSLEELNKRDSLVSRLEEELSVTSRSYKDQLNSMTEHMANLSDKLAAQETMIEDLTYELSTKLQEKKGKAK